MLVVGGRHRAARVVTFSSFLGTQLGLGTRDPPHAHSAIRETSWGTKPLLRPRSQILHAPLQLHSDSTDAPGHCRCRLSRLCWRNFLALCGILPVLELGGWVATK